MALPVGLLINFLFSPIACRSLFLTFVQAFPVAYFLVAEQFSRAYSQDTIGQFIFPNSMVVLIAETDLSGPGDYFAPGCSLSPLLIQVGVTGTLREGRASPKSSMGAFQKIKNSSWPGHSFIWM